MSGKVRRFLLMPQLELHQIYWLEEVQCIPDSKYLSILIKELFWISKDQLIVERKSLKLIWLLSMKLHQCKKMLFVVLISFYVIWWKQQIFLEGRLFFWVEILGRLCLLLNLAHQPELLVLALPVAKFFTWISKYLNSMKTWGLLNKIHNSRIGFLGSETKNNLMLIWVNNMSKYHQNIFVKI